MEAIKNAGDKRVTANLVAIVGGSCAGKTWLAERLEAELKPAATRLSLDDFYRDRSHLSPAQRQRVNFDHPRAIDWEKLEEVLRGYLAQSETETPRYNFERHSREEQGRKLQSKPILIMEGLWLLRRSTIRRCCAIRIFVNCPAELRVNRRVQRDVQERGRDEQSVREQWKTVAPMHERFVAPQVRWADIVLESPITEESVQSVLKQIRKLIKPEQTSYDRP